MNRTLALSTAAVALVVIVALVLSSGGGDSDETTTNPLPPSGFAPPSRGAAPPSGSGVQLPPGIAECLADKGFDIEPSELHSVPPQVLSACFQALHQGGGSP